MNEYKDLLKRLDSSLKGVKKSSCKHCKSTKLPVNTKGLCESCDSTLTEKRKAALAEKRNHNAAGYVYVYDENGRSVLEHRFLMEKQLGRKLESHEVVLHLDGTKDNNDLSNLVLGFKNGTPLNRLRCLSCDSVGKFTFESEPNVEPQLELPQELNAPLKFRPC